jgi:hypothetical protein
MNKTLTIFKTFLLLSFLFNLNTLSAQADDIVVTCPMSGCGSDDDYGTTGGTYVDSGMTDNGQPIYEGPTGGPVNYHIKCVDEVLGGGALIVYRWEVHAAIDGTLVYFDSKIENNFGAGPFPVSEINDVWTEDNSAFLPIPSMIGVLPVELSYFKAKQENKAVKLNWQTTTELNNEGFEIQRSVDNRNWETLDFIAGEGTSYETQNYEYLDERPASGKNYYRLKQIDFDGRFVYSSILIEEMSLGSLQISPNPVNGQTINLQFPSSDYEDAEFEVYDNLGRMIVKSVLSYGEKQVDISDLSPGFYIVTVKVGGQLLQERLIKK